MPGHCLLCYITDRTAFAADEPTRRRRLLEKIAEAARAGVDYIQLREKDLSTRELESLAREAVSTVRGARKLTTDHWLPTTVLLINSRTDVALAVEADGVHLRSEDISPQEVQRIWNSCGAGTPARQLSPEDPLIAVSGHSPAAVKQAEGDGASFAVFAPVFEKKDVPGSQAAGLVQLREACKASIPVLALGGVKLENTKSCLEAGAAGIAAIRLFQENNVTELVKKMKAL
ncbi:MAG: thiamine phosphate synthase [Candidatus Sulfotelmatobacter sp.]